MRQHLLQHLHQHPPIILLFPLLLLLHLPHHHLPLLCLPCLCRAMLIANLRRLQGHAGEETMHVHASRLLWSILVPCCYY